MFPPPSYCEAASFKVKLWELILTCFILIFKSLKFFKMLIVPHLDAGVKSSPEISPSGNIYRFTVSLPFAVFLQSLIYK